MFNVQLARSRCGGHSRNVAGADVIPSGRVVGSRYRRDFDLKISVSTRSSSQRGYDETTGCAASQINVGIQRIPDEIYYDVSRCDAATNARANRNISLAGRTAIAVQSNDVPSDWRDREVCRRLNSSGQ